MATEHRGGVAHSAPDALAAHSMTVPSRRLRRLEVTREIKVRKEFRRRKAVTRSGVMVSFVLAMVVYPMLGTITPYAGALEHIPGVTLGETPSTAHAILGNGPQLHQVILPPPSVDEQAIAFLVSQQLSDYDVSQYLPGCDPSVEMTSTNGNLTDAELCTLSWNKNIQLRADAAVALAELNERFKIHFGRSMCITSGYRSYADQVRVRNTAGGMAARPGRSVHGLGLALDLCSGDDRGETKQWLEDNAPAWGWVNPGWAKTTKWEPWHWEYEPGTDALNFYNGATWESDDGQEVESDDPPKDDDKKDTTTPDPTPPPTREPDPPVTDPEPDQEPTPDPDPNLAPSPAPTGDQPTA